MYTVYTDGAYMSSINCGGCSAIITHNGKIVKKLYKGFKNTTNNRMEIFGVIMALEYFTTSEKIEIYSDSSYVVNSINGQHVQKWFENQDFTKKNLDLWFRLLEAMSIHDVKFYWVKGHNGHQFNEIADLYATHSCTCLNIPIDENINIQKIS